MKINSFFDEKFSTTVIILFTTHPFSVGMVFNNNLKYEGDKKGEAIRSHKNHFIIH